MYDGIIPLQSLKTVVAMQDSALSETVLYLYNTLRFELYLCDSLKVDLHKCMHLFCAAWSLCYRSFLSRKNDVELKIYTEFNLGFKYLFFLIKN